MLNKFNRVICVIILLNFLSINIFMTSIVLNKINYNIYNFNQKLKDLSHFYFNNYIILTNNNNNSYLTNGTFYPHSGTGSTIFTFEVVYVDIGGSAPEFVKLVLLPLCNKEINITMGPVNGTGLNYTNGVLYRCNVSDLEEGNYYHYYVANTSTGEIIRYPEIGVVDGPVVKLPYMTNETYYPHSGTGSTIFTFEVVYVDIGGSAPEFVKLVLILYDLRSLCIKKINIIMGPVDGTGLNYTNGVLYRCSVSNLEEGSYSHYYIANTSTGEIIRYPIAGDIQWQEVESSFNLFSTLIVFIIIINILFTILLVIYLVKSLFRFKNLRNR